MKARPLFLLGILLAPCLQAASPASGAAKPKPRVPYVHHALPLTETGFYAVFLPKRYQADSARGKKYPLCVILHGSGSNEIDHGSWALAFRDEDIIFCAPRAPHADFESYAESHAPGWTAWPGFPEEWGEFDSPEFPKRELDGIDDAGFYADWIADCIKDMRKRYPIAEGKAIVIGHSEGAAFAHISASRHPELIKAYASFAGYYPLLGDSSAAHGLRSGAVFSEIIHCESDSQVPVAESRRVVKYLETYHLPYTARFLPDCGHELAGAPSLALRDFVYGQCLGKPAPPLHGFVIIDRVSPHGPADSLGLLPGDRILSYDGKVIRSGTAFMAARKSAAGKERIQLIVERDGKSLPFLVGHGRLGIGIGDR